MEQTVKYLMPPRRVFCSSSNDKRSRKNQARGQTTVLPVVETKANAYRRNRCFIRENSESQKPGAIFDFRMPVLNVLNDGMKSTRRAYVSWVVYGHSLYVQPQNNDR